MISAQNHHPRSSGNNIFLLLFLAAIVLPGCALLKPKETGKKPPVVYRPDPEVKKEREREIKVKPDTLVWIDEEIVEEIPDQDYKKVELESIEKPDIEAEEIVFLKKDLYRIDLLIPFNSYTPVGSLEDIENSYLNKMIHFYGGMILAMEELRKKGANFEINVIDIPVDSDKTRSYLASAEIHKPDLIIGPNDGEQIRQVNKFARENNIPVLSPWRALPNVYEGNSLFVQLRPSLRTYYAKMLEAIDEDFSPEDVFLIGLDDTAGKSRIRSIVSMHTESDHYRGDFDTLFVNMDMLDQEEPVFESIFKHSSEKKAIILPNWSFRDEDFIFKCLSRINLEKGEQLLEIYGMPILMQSERISYDLFRMLNIRVVSPIYHNDANPKFNSFRKSYYDQFKVFPSEDAYEGYDVMMFAGHNLMTYGSNFPFALIDKDMDYLVTGYYLRNLFENNATGEPGYLENKKLFLIGFENNKFIRIK